MGWIRVKATDIITNKKSGETFNLTAVEKHINDSDIVILKNTETNGEIRITINEYRNSYKVTTYGDPCDKFFML